MDYPLGEWSGNSCEVFECIDAMTPGSELMKMLDLLTFDSTHPTFVKLNNDNKPKDIREVLIYFTFVLILNMYILTGGKPEEGF